ncbi:uncharacterized protein [Battus philenor]|uniref:uncharacterized protein n=1 Tax=Battus philenor TaxID=42288 RepID=UPI0035D10FDF
MNYFKDYTQKMRKQALQVVNIILCGNISPELNHYIQLLDNLKINHESYQEYYGEVKRIINSFIIHWTEVMNRAVKEADKASQVVTKEDLIYSVEKTIELQKIKQTIFEEAFLPVASPEEKAAYDEILEEYDKYLLQLEEIKVAVSKMRDLETMERFAKDHFAISLRKKNQCFVFTHTYIAMILENNVVNIRVSLEEIEHRVRNNLRSMKQERDAELTGLLNELYNKNKEHLAMSRKPRRNSAEIAEVRSMVQDCMEKLKKKIEDHKEVILTRLEEEANYWKAKLEEFNHIANTFDVLKDVKKNILEQQQMYLDLRDERIPLSKRKCWEHMEKSFVTKLERLEERRKEAGRALISFFSVRGPDRIFYNDSIGRYYVDEHGHRVYSYDYGLNMYHVNCEGELYKTHDTEAYFYDRNGRYILDNNGEKVYKIAPCTSSYRLIDDVMTKCTLDCGHSELSNKNCKMDIRDRDNDPYLPEANPVDMKGLLNSETALYLWESFGHVLPEVLNQVASDQPKNPIHYLAHKILAYKYGKTAKEMQQKKEEAAKYRDAIYKDRKEKAIAASKAWKAKQVKRRKPEESDDSDGRAYEAFVARQEFIISLETIYGDFMF